jgi:hypothetical protein
LKSLRRLACPEGFYLNKRSEKQALKHIKIFKKKLGLKNQKELIKNHTKNEYSIPRIVD